jgi:hypothetical protein
MADRYIERLFRRLLLAGVPILPASCVLGCSSCPDDPALVERYIEIANPAGADSGVTPEAYQRCVDALDCGALCAEAVPFGSIKTCQRVATDGLASGSERVALDVGFIPLCEGRRTEGQPERTRSDQSGCDVGAWLAEAAYLEAASVPAFERLSSELAAHDAPVSLLARAGRARRDEVRHRRMITALARRYGAIPAPLTAAAFGDIRPLAEVAMENAVEGCVRETLGAAIAAHQAVTATDPVVRGCLRVVARDETSHARLAWDVHTWSMKRLGSADRKHAHACLYDGIDALGREIRAAVPSPTVARTLGLPALDGASEIVAEMRRALDDATQAA